jgi:uncharacterized protein YlxW (UPF0749 family)
MGVPHDGPHHAAPPAHHGRRRSWLWRVGTPAAVLVCGGLFAVSAVNSHGTDLRPGRYDDLSQLYSAQKHQAQRLTDQVHALQQQIDALTKAVPDSEVRSYQRRIATVEGAAGLSRVSGPGVAITLTDAPQANLDNSPLNANVFVVHQQDIQAVVNALWRGGATAVTIQGQRVISTTGIKCTGSTVTLQGVPYPEPFVIRAVGDPAALQTALDEDSYVSLYRQQSADPQIGIGWKDDVESRVVAPAYTGLRDLTYAKPVTGGPAT